MLAGVIRFITFLFRLLFRTLFGRRKQVISSSSFAVYTSNTTKPKKEDEERKQIEQAILLHCLTQELVVPNEMYYFVPLKQPDISQVTIPSEKMEVETTKVFNRFARLEEVEKEQVITTVKEEVIPQAVDTSSLLHHLIQCFRYEYEEEMELPIIISTEPKIIYPEELEITEPVPSVADASVIDAMPQPGD